MRIRTSMAMVAAMALLAACGDDSEPSGTSTEVTTTAVSTTATESTTTTATSSPTTGSPTTEAPTTSTAAPTTSTTTPTLAQPAIWPAAGVVYATPEEAAANFVQTVLGVNPVLGDYMGGDSRSGEIEVFSPGEGTRVSRGLLFLRKIGPTDGWFVIGAANDFATIATPDVNAEVLAGPLTVTGVGRGFEGTVVITAFIAGKMDVVLDRVITAGGAQATAEPYSVTIDLSGANAGDIVTLLVKGDVGLETDPGDFGAIPVVIAG